jgi:hypothetical protein
MVAHLPLEAKRMAPPRIPTPPLLSFLALLLSILPSACGILGLGEDPVEDRWPGETSLLFIGSSYLAFNDVPERVREFAVGAGHEVYMQSRTFMGAPLVTFANDPGTAHLIRSRDWDFVILQGSGYAVAYPDGSEDSVSWAVQELARIAREGGSATRVLYMMPWAFEDGMLWVEGRTESYEDMQLDIRERVLELSAELDVGVAPVGMAFFEVLTTWDHGTHFLHDPDWSHASEKGSYLAAATIYCSIFTESVTGIDHPWIIEPDTARALRDVATRTVLDSLSLWNIDW